MRRLVSIVAAACISAALAGCTVGPTREAHPLPTSTVSRFPSELQTLATAGTLQTYTATYLFHLAKPSATALVKVWQSPPSLRIDVISGTTTASLFITRTGIYSCGVRPRHKACFIVAKPGHPIPAPFNVGPSSLFSNDLNTFARHGASYVVAQAPTTPASTRVLQTNCFTVKPGVLSPSPQVQPGTYCLSDIGVVTAVTYPSGNSASLSAFSFNFPPATMKPYAKASALPS